MGMADHFVNILNNVLRRDFDKLGKEVIEETQDIVSVRVERHKGRVIRSKPGEPPRYDSGELSRSLGYEVDVDETGAPTLILYCHKKGMWLEEKLDRPFLSTITQRHIDDLGDDFLTIYG